MKLAFLSLLFVLTTAHTQNDIGSIELVISETATDEGVIQLLIFDQEKGWPESLDGAWKMETIPIKNGVARNTITDVPAGNYAITVFHDHDEDGKIRKNKVGYPLDNFGFSNNPSLIFGVPSFNKCSQKVLAGQKTIFEIELK